MKLMRLGEHQAVELIWGKNNVAVVIEKDGRVCCQKRFDGPLAAEELKKVLEEYINSCKADGELEAEQEGKAGDVVYFVELERVKRGYVIAVEKDYIIATCHTLNVKPFEMQIKDMCENRYARVVVLKKEEAFFDVKEAEKRAAKSRGYVVRILANPDKVVVEKIDGELTLDVLQKMVGGFIEPVSNLFAKKGIVVLADEEGVLSRKSVNLTATVVCGRDLIECIVGDVVLVKAEGESLVPLTRLEACELCDEIRREELGDDL